jgi:putative transposase
LTPSNSSNSDAGIGEAISQLEYKAIEVGGTVQKVDHFFPSSKLCPACGQKNESLTLSEREWMCMECTAYHDRDLNAALNIEVEGLRLLAGSSYLGVTPVELAASV